MTKYNKNFYELLMGAVCINKKTSPNMKVWEFESGNYEKNIVIYNDKTKKWIVDFYDRVDFYDSFVESESLMNYLKNIKLFDELRVL